MKQPGFAPGEAPAHRRAGSRRARGGRWRASGRGRIAFTLIELLVVITIIALLATIVIPSLKSGVAIARTVVCANNLHHIGTAFQNQHPGDGVSVARPYPDKTAWPAVPQNVMPEHRLYFCPEQKQEHVGLDAYTVLLHGETRDGQLGVHISFGRNDESVQGLCEIYDRSDLNPPQDEYWFDDGLYEDVDDFVFLVTKDPPRVAKFMPRGWYGQGKGKPRGSPSGETETRIVSLCFNRKVIPGWERFRTVEDYKQITLAGGGATNYGINAKADRIRAGSNKIVVLDFLRLVATDEEGQDLHADLEHPASARHRGRLNVLFGDRSVRLMGPSELDPQIYPDLWSASAP